MSLSIDPPSGHRAVKCVAWQKTHRENSFGGALHSLMFPKPVITDIFQKYHQNYFPHPKPRRWFLVVHHRPAKHDSAHRDIAPFFVDLPVPVHHLLSPKDNPKLALRIQADNLICQLPNNQDLNFAYNDHKWLHSHLN